MNKNGSSFILDAFPRSVSDKQCKDTGLAMILIALIIVLVSGSRYAVFAAFLLTIADMVYPRVFYPLAVIWFGLSMLIGTIVSKLLLSVLFFIVVTPVGMIRKFLGSDPMKTRQWKRGSESVFQERNHAFTTKDIEKPY
jgi:multisubunit Na+/H+ antiporter MnhG subunit